MTPIPGSAAPRCGPHRGSAAIIPLTLPLLALAVRLHGLTYHSLWFDEAMSVHWARSSLARIWEVSMNLVEDRLPPLYYLMLHFWNLAAGKREMAERFPSVVFGVLLVPVVYRLGCELYDRRVALVAAVLAALSPFLVWYSQEARMYALAALLSVLGTWCFLRGVRAVEGSGSRWAAWPWWLGYGLCATAGLYTHLYTGFLLPVHALYLLFTWRRSRRSWLPYTITMTVACGLFLPLAGAILRAGAEAGPGDPWQGLFLRLWDLLSALTVWQAPLPTWVKTLVPAGLLLLAVVGLCPCGAQPESRGVPHPRLLVGLLWLLPVAIATGLMTRNRLAFFGARYFVVILPWMLLAVAAGTVSVARRLAATRRPLRAMAPVAVLVPLALTLVPLPGLWSPAARKEAWRETVALLAAFAQPDDAILIHPDWTRYPFQYYFHGPGQTYAVFSSVEDDAQLDPPLEAISSQHPVVWLVESHTELADPKHQANAWLAARFPLVTELYPPGLAAVRAYAPGYITDRVPDFAAPVTAVFDDGLELAGFWLPSADTPAADDVFHPPSAWVHVALFWRADGSYAGEAVPFVNLIDSAGQVWGASLDRAGDAFDFYPPSRWQAGQVIRLDADVNLNPQTPPGDYALVVGLRDAGGAQILLNDAAPQAILSSITVTLE